MSGSAWVYHVLISNTGIRHRTESGKGIAVSHLQPPEATRYRALKHDGRWTQSDLDIADRITAVSAEQLLRPAAVALGSAGLATQRRRPQGTL